MHNDDFRLRRQNMVIGIAAVLSMLGVVACAMITVERSIGHGYAALERADTANSLLRKENAQLTKRLLQTGNVGLKTPSHRVSVKTFVNYKTLYEALQKKVDDMKVHIELEQSRVERLTAVNKGHVLEKLNLKRTIVEHQKMVDRLQKTNSARLDKIALLKKRLKESRKDPTDEAFNAELKKDALKWKAEAQRLKAALHEANKTIVNLRTTKK